MPKSFNNNFQPVDLALQVAHDIRAPLAVLRSQLANNLLGSDRSLTEQAFHRIDSLIGELRDTRAQLPRQNKRSVPMSLQKIILEKIQVCRIEKTDKVKFNLTIADPSNDLYIPGLTDHFERVLSNILDNSIEALANKHDGEITIELNAINGMMHLRIEDNGPGFSRALIPFLGDSPVTLGKVGGSGRGLYFAARFCNNLDGSLECSNCDKAGGASVVIQIPILH